VTRGIARETYVLLIYFTTANTARDVDRIRIALGVPKISYWGQSYGTYLGCRLHHPVPAAH
jgi:pimeloyl-ACP methyl ester carboxylesterase